MFSLIWQRHRLFAFSHLAQAMWVALSDPSITGHYLQFLASLSIHPFCLEIFPAAHLLRVTAEPRLRNASRTAQNNPQFKAMVPILQISNVTKKLEFPELFLLKLQIHMIDVATFFTRSVKPGWFHWCRHSCQFLVQQWSHLQAEWEPVCRVVICSPDTRTATAAPRSILI